MEKCTQYARIWEKRYFRRFLHTNVRYPPSFILGDGIKYENVERGEDDDGAELCRDQGVDAVEDGVVPDIKHIQ